MLLAQYLEAVKAGSIIQPVSKMHSGKDVVIRNYKRFNMEKNVAQEKQNPSRVSMHFITFTLAETGHLSAQKSHVFQSSERNDINIGHL